MQPHKYLNLPIQSSIMITDFTTLISHYITSIIVIKGNIIGIFEWKPLIDLEVFVTLYYLDKWCYVKTGHQCTFYTSLIANCMQFCTSLKKN